MPAGSPDSPAIDEESSRWQEWWVRNEHMFIRVEKGGAVSSGSEMAIEDMSGEMKDLVKFLLGMLRHGYWDVRAASALALGKVGLRNEEIRMELEAAVSDKDRNVRESAALALGMIRSVKSSLLLSSRLGDKTVDAGLRANCALALGLMGDPSNLRMLSGTALGERKDEVKAAAVTALGLLGDEKALKTLLEVFRSGEEEDIRALAVTAIGKLGVSSCQENPASNGRVNLAREFEKHLLNKETKVRVRQSLAMILGKIGDSRTADALKAAASGDRDRVVRSFALLSLARLCKGTDQAVSVREMLRRTLRDEKNVTVRSYAALAAGLSGDSEAAPILRGLFESGEHADVRSAAAIGLGILKDAESMALFGKELNNPKGGGDVRRFACIALGLIGDKNAGDCLRKVLETVNQPYLKWSAAIGLARLGDKSCMDMLVRNLTDGSSIVKESAIRAIGYFRDEAQIRTLIDHMKKESSDEIKAMYVVSLGYIGDSASEVPVLRRVSQDFNWLASLKYVSIDFVTRVF